MNSVEAEQVHSWIKFAYEVAEEALGKAPKHYFTWSQHMTSVAGMVQWKQVRDVHGDYVLAAPTIKLSVKIFNKAVEDLGIEEVCEKVYWVMLHELAHLYAGPGVTHGPRWQGIMVELGLDPQEYRYHDMAYGKRLVSEDLRTEFRLGRTFRFLDDKKQWHEAKVARHNTKNCRCWVAGYLSWNLPWSWLERNKATRVVFEE